MMKKKTKKTVITVVECRTPFVSVCWTAHPDSLWKAAALKTPVHLTDPHLKRRLSDWMDSPVNQTFC